MTKQTAVEWLEQTIESISVGRTSVDRYKEMILSFVKKAKQIEKEQIIEAFDEGQEYEYQYHINSAPKFDSLTYYNETFNQ